MNVELFVEHECRPTNITRVEDNCAEHTELGTGAGLSFLQLYIELTDVGMDSFPGCGLAVVQIVFDYIHMLKTLGPQKWLWLEQKAISEHAFRYGCWC